MLEHSAMYLNVTPPYEDEQSFFPDFYTRISGPCELDPVWSKMNLAGVNKKRKKSDNKPQAQLNKCNNEKRRREQENIYIEELAELISANFADMSSFAVKPDKCAILQETVKQIRRIKQQETANEQNSDPVQQGEVSSSRPTILSNEVYGPLLLEALEGFLFVVSNDGKVEHVTENVSTYIRYTKDEMIGKTIYNFMHPGDHTKFHSTLLPMSIEWGNDQAPPTRSKSIDVRLLVKDDMDDSVEEKRQGVTCYELMHISSTQLRDSFSMSEDDSNGESGPCLLCVASRISQREKASCSFEQFTTKLDRNGKILDTSGVTDATSQALRTDLKNKMISQLVPPQDVHKVSAHLKEALTTGQSISQVYRIQVAPDKFVQVQTKSKLFKTNTLNSQNNDGDFIMATHTIIGENDTLGPGDPGGGSNSSIGGPLMTSVVNGTGGGSAAPRNGTISSAGSDISQSTNSSGGNMLNAGNAGATVSGMGPNSVFGPGYLDSDFTIDFPTTTWPDLETNWPEAARPDSRQSVTPVSTPTSRPPSQPSYSNAPTVAQSPMASHFGAQQSPIMVNHQPASQQSQNSFSSWMETDFSDQNCFETIKDTKENVEQQEAPSLSDSHRLRSLLTTTTSTTSTTASQSQDSSTTNDNRDRILKALLNQQDEDQGGHGGTSREPIMPRPLLMSGEQMKSGGVGGVGNNMLRQLLNDKTDDDEKEKMSGLKKRSELLQQLLKKDSNDDDDKKHETHPQEDSLLRSLGFSPGSPDRRGPKRSMDDKDEHRDSKRTSDGSQVSSTGSDSELCKKNKMLASLLAKHTHTPPTIPSVPNSVISAIPQEKLPRIVTDPAKVIGGTMAQIMNNVRRNSMPVGRSYLGTNVQRSGHINTGYSPATSTSDSHINWGENNNIHAAVATDTVPADLLEELMDLVPDNNADVTILRDTHKPPQTSSGLSEALAIYTIQKDLMQCESTVKSPTSPNISLPARPPAYPQVSSHNNLGYPPPPNYLQASKYQRSLSVRGAGPQYATANNLTNQQLLLQQQRKQLLHQQQQQQEKQRLLQQQKQQQLLIPSNATAADMNNMQNIDSIMNNTVAPPNVSLQRSSSIPDAQLSPKYSGQIHQGSNSLGQQNQRGQQNQQQSQPYSPLSQMPSPLGGQNFQAQTTVGGSYQSQTARMSPQSQFNAQLSPRQAYPQGNGTPSSGAWPPQRMTIQQNPMLNAQLTRAPQQNQRSLNSPGTGPSRHSPFAGDQFPPPSSPNNSTGFTQAQYMQRLQRANSVPTSNSAQLPGGLGSPRSYSGGGHHAPPHYPTAVPQTPPQNPSLNAPGIPPPHHPMMYQQDSYHCYDQTPMAYSPDQRGVRAQQPPHNMQTGVPTNPTSEFVRQELRAVVSNRTAQGGQPGGGGQQQRGGMVSQQQSQQQQQSNLLSHQQAVDLEALGISFEMPTGASDSPKLWGAMGSDLGAVTPQQQATTRTTMDEIRPGDHAKTSLLQQLLSDQSK